ncbi:MAG: sporulation protein YqfD [Candidatus Borkfalkiaceae bacterium]|nr:sporulation protein YqfD [Clostridia bacterium]MDY6223627.1 sporulation protein YqfD [Christensenellaceae bacterium]
MSGAGVWRREKLRIRGREPEKALQRLKNAGIVLFDVKKTQKDALTFCVNGKQAQKVFAIYPKTWYNKAERGGYEVTSLGEKGLYVRLKRLEKRPGLIAGAAAFLLITAFCDNFVFDVRYSGDAALCDLAENIVIAHGIKPFSKFSETNAEEVAAEILSLQGVSYANVNKRGTVVYVEARRSSFAGTGGVTEGDMLASHEGTLIEITALRGEKACDAGEKVKKGDLLVSSTLKTGEGESERRLSVTVVARAEILCVYQCSVTAESEAVAAAVAGFYLGEREKENYYTVQSVSTQSTGRDEYAVTIEYVATETINY